jgi:iron complex outermembrane receptor protein
MSNQSKTPQAASACRRAAMTPAWSMFLLGTALAASLSAQVTAPASEEKVTLPEFTVRSQTDDSFVAKDAMSTTRTGVDLANLAQSVVVINKEFLGDLKPTYISDVMRHIGGGQTGTLTWTGSTRYMMRGYTSEGNFVDGFKFPSGNTNFGIIDRVEVIKGPSAIFVTNSANTVGGMVNKLTKSPTSYHVGEITIDAALWDRGTVNLDYGGALSGDKKLQYRLLMSGTSYNRYWDNDGRDKRWSIMPMLSYDFTPSTKAWIKFERHNHNYGAYEGVPLDGRTGKPALGRKGNLHEAPPLNWRKADYDVIWGQFTTRPASFLAVRLAALKHWENNSRVQSIVNPTGATTPSKQADGSFAFLPNAQYTIPPNYVPGQLIARTTTVNVNRPSSSEVQNDYVFNFSTGSVKHTFLAGGVLRYDDTTQKNYSSGSTSTATSSAIDPFNPKFPGTVFVDFDAPPTNVTERNDIFAKWFVLETASLLQDRLILTYGASRNRFSQATTSQNYNQRTKVMSAQTSVPRKLLYKDLIQYSALFKPMPHVSLFYGYNVNFAANPIQFGEFLPPQEGRQTEVGIKTDWLSGRLNVSASYFDIKQLNNTVQPFPQTTPTSFILVNGVTSKGVDGDISYSVSQNFSLIASFAVFNAESAVHFPWNVTPQPGDGKTYSRMPVNNVSERNLSVWGRYKFSQGALKGVAVGLGVSNVAKRAITDNANLIFYGYIPGYTLVDANINYETKKFRYQLRIDNLLNNSSYIYASRSNNVIVPGTPINIGGSVSYKF